MKRHYNLVAANFYEFSLERPFLDSLNQASPNRILTHIFPFLRIAFGIPNHVIKKSAFPNFGPLRTHLSTQDQFQHPPPLLQAKLARSRYKYVQVIGHDNIPSYCDLLLLETAESEISKG